MIRICQIAITVGLAVCVAGCNKPEEQPAVKLTQLGIDANNPEANALKTINFELQVFEIPVDRLKDIDEIRQALETEQFKYTSRLAFSENSFSVYFGRVNSLATVQGVLNDASTQKQTSMSLMMSEGQEHTIDIISLNSQRVVFYMSGSGQKEGARVGPGMLGLRLKAEKTEDAANACQITAFPVLSIQAGHTISQIDEQIKKQEFPFTVATFGLDMKAGDFVLLAPETLTTEPPGYLSSLFFNIPGGSQFFDQDKRKAPVIKPSVRIFLLICTWINIY
jgi:hypothetical protein